MEWMVGILGDVGDLKELSKSLNSDRLCIIKDKDGFVLKSKDFASLVDYKDVLSKGKELISFLNGAARLFLDIRNPLTSGAVIKVEDAGNRSIFFEVLDIAMALDMGIVNGKIIRKDGTVEEFHQADPIPPLIMLAQKNNNVGIVLRLLGSGNYDWVNLYRIYEIIKADMGGVNSIVNKQWTTNKVIARFTHTANSPDASGDQSRHGKGEPAPKDPMSLVEAKSFIEGIIHNWIRLKIL